LLKQLTKHAIELQTLPAFQLAVSNNRPPLWAVADSRRSTLVPKSYARLDSATSATSLATLLGIVLNLLTGVVGSTGTPVLLRQLTKHAKELQTLLAFQLAVSKLDEPERRLRLKCD
jgi:hypothetical protein